MVTPFLPHHPGTNRSQWMIGVPVLNDLAFLDYKLTLVAKVALLLDSATVVRASQVQRAADLPPLSSTYAFLKPVGATHVRKPS